MRAEFNRVSADTRTHFLFSPLYRVAYSLPCELANVKEDAARDLSMLVGSDREESVGGPEEESRESRRGPRLSWLIPAVVAAGLAAVLVAVSVSATRTQEGGSAGSEELGVAVVGAPAPDFEVELLSGGRFSLRDSYGKVVLVNFWGTWCLPCEKEMPLLQRASEEFAEDLVVVGLAVNDSRSAVADFVAKRAIGFPIALDDGRVAGYYLVTGFPTSVLVGRDGRVVSRVSKAFPDYESLAAQIRVALKR